MILNQNTSNVSTIGDIQKNQVSIDAKNINHIVTILSSNLYSNPEESFLRETISNAVDSHTEAGVTEPIVLTITEKTIAIRDFGVGISPERFKEIYLNIGSSTKRESNDYIGSFGIGRFSALSCSNLVNITSYYEGKAYYYVMMKDIGKLSIDLVSTTDTTEHNGVEVKIPITEPYVYIDLLHTLNFIPNIYVNSNISTYQIGQFNDRKIYTYKNFKYCDCRYGYSSEPRILIGNIQYKVDRSHFREFYMDSNYADVLRDVLPILNIGDVDVTPNRESILYSKKTIDKIKSVLTNCIQEFDEIIKATYDKDYDDFIEFIKNEVLNNEKYLVLDGNRHNYTIRHCKVKGTFKKDTYDQELFNSKTFSNVIYVLFHTDIHIAGYKEDNYIYRGAKLDSTLNSLLWKKYKGYRFSDKEVIRRLLIIPSVKGFSSVYLKGYLLSHYKENLAILEKPSEDFYRGIEDTIKYYEKGVLTEYTKKLYDISRTELIDSLKRYCYFDDVINSKEYKEYKEEQKKLATKDTTKFAKETTYYVTRISEGNTSYRISYSTKSLQGIVDKFTDCYSDCVWVYTIMDDPNIYKLSQFCNKDVKYVVLSVAKSNWKILKGLPNRFVPITELLNKNSKKMQIAAAITKINQSEMNVHGIVTTAKEFLRYINKKDADAIQNFAKISDRNGFAITDVEPAPEVLEWFNVCKRYYNIAQATQYLRTYIPCINALFVFLCFKQKLLRPNFETYREVRRKLKFKI